MTDEYELYHDEVYVAKDRPDTSYQKSAVLRVHDYFAYMPSVADFQTCIDIGAHIGAFSVAMLKRAPKCHVVAIEPDVASYGQLILNTTRWSDRVSIYQGAVYYTEKTLHYFGTFPDTTGGCVNDGLFRGGELVRALTLERICREQGFTRQIDLIKLNCNTCEFNILTHASDGLLERVGCIVGEVYAPDQQAIELLESTLHKTHRLRLSYSDFSDSVRFVARHV